MTSTDPLEGRLRGLSLELPEQGSHLDDERLAEIVEGSDPTAAEAIHLAGCDVCCEVMMLLGEGLADMAQSESPSTGTTPSRPASIHAFPKGGRKGRWSTAGLVLAFATAAAAAWGVYTVSMEHPTPTKSDVGKTLENSTVAPIETPKVDPQPTMVDKPTALDVVKPASIEPVDSVASPSTPPLVAPSPLTASVTEDPAEKNTTSTGKPRIQKRKASRPTSSAMESPPGTLSGRRGPRPLNRMPVNGAPRGFGALRLNAKPSALVFVDGKAYGWTPLLNLRLPSGPHDVKLVYKSPLAAEKEQRFRILIQDDETWSTVRDNRLRK